MGWTNATRGAVLALLLLVMVTAGGCAAVAGIFKAGMWVGVIVAVIVIGLVLFIFSRVTSR